VRTHQQSELQKADHVLESKPGNQAEAVLKLEAGTHGAALGRAEVATPVQKAGVAACK
jgi:hypothetical protein